MVTVPHRGGGYTPTAVAVWAGSTGAGVVSSTIPRGKGGGDEDGASRAPVIL